MKKVIVIILLLAIVGGCAAAFYGFYPVGEYKLESVSMKMGGVMVDYQVGESFFGLALSPDVATLTLNKDHTYVMKSSLIGFASATGTWKMEGLAIVLDGEHAARLKWRRIEVGRGVENSSEYSCMVMKKA